MANKPRYISFWCFDCRIAYYKGEFKVSNDYKPNYDRQLKLCVRCRKRTTTRRSIVVPEYSDLYVSKHLIYTWLGMPMSIGAAFKLFFMKHLPRRFPPIRKILKKVALYNNLFLDFIKDIDRAYQLRNEGQDIDLSGSDKNFAYWNSNFNKLKVALNTARIFLENPPRNFNHESNAADFQIEDFEKKVKELDTFLNDYSKIKQNI